SGPAGCGEWQGTPHADDGRRGQARSVTTWALLAPGPSASAEDAERVRAAGIPLGVIGNAFQLAPWADCLAATDSAWWRKYREAMTRPGAKYTMHQVKGGERVKVAGYVSVNSGVLGMEVDRS